jgi:hypothetical protein
MHTGSFPVQKGNWHCGSLCWIVPQTVMYATWQVPVEDTSFLKVLMHDLPLLMWYQGNWNFLLESAASSSLQHVLHPFRPPLVGAIDRSCSGPALWEWWGNPANYWQDICSNWRWYLVSYTLKGKPIPVRGRGGP